MNVVDTMNAYDARNMQGDTVISDRCLFCGRMSTEQHHVVYRSRGGKSGPTVPVCGWGNTSGCHGMIHQHCLHVRWNGEWWEFLKTDEPCKDDVADGMRGWRKCRKPTVWKTFGAA